VPVGRNEMRGLVGGRNLLAGFVVRRGQGKTGKGEGEDPFLPRTIDDERTCKRCYALDTCMLYRKVHSSPPPCLI
jgi:DNA replication ATP-dependent helicase Dna2